MRAAGQDEMFGATGLVGVAGDLDGAVVGGWFTVDQTLRIERPRAAGAVGHALGDAAAVGVDQPTQVQHLAERHCPKVEIEAGHEHVVAGLEQVFGEDEKAVDELALVDGDTLHALADLLLFLLMSSRTGQGSLELNSIAVHLGVAVGIAAFDQAGTALGVVAGFENQHRLAGVLTAHFAAAQQFGRLVAAHRSQHQFEFALHPHHLI